MRAEQVFPTCPRYIHQYRLVQRSRFVPREGETTPVPRWKRADWSYNTLPVDDPARDPDREVVHRG